MSKYLISTVETYHVDSENEVAVMLEEAKEDSRFVLSKYNDVLKEIKEKGEVVGEYHALTLTKVFDDMKFPCGCAKVEYEV